MVEPFIENLEEAEKTIRIADHMIYVTYPLIKDKNLLLKILIETKKGITECINSILQYEYFYKRINLRNDPKENFKIFEDKCSERYDITKDEIKLILELFELAKKHKESPFEFAKGEKVVIFTENSKTITVTIEKIKIFLEVAKKIIKKTKLKLQKT